MTNATTASHTIGMTIRIIGMCAARSLVEGGIPGTSRIGRLPEKLDTHGPCRTNVLDATRKIDVRQSQRDEHLRR